MRRELVELANVSPRITGAAQRERDADKNSENNENTYLLYFNE